MPTLVLAKRNGALQERMSDPQCDLEHLNNTYRYFAIVNRLVAGWRRVYERHILPLRPRSLLDIGCGGGDVARAAAAWASRDGLVLEITAIDPDPRALAFATAKATPPNVRFLKASSAELVAAGERFDVVVSNHLLHHLEPHEITSLCRDSEHLAIQKAIHNDIRRSDLAYLGFGLTRPFFPKSFITYDGLISIRRSFTAAELAELAPLAWQVEALFPYRNLLLYQP